jgi:cytochrome c
LKLPEPKTDFDAKLFTKVRVDDKIVRSSWIRRQSSGTFRHEFSSHSDLECSTCHTVATINTADPATQKVSISSCAICHVTGTVEDGGAVNIEADARKKDAKFECIKCHIVFGKLPIPVSHVKILAEAK